jgi:predicted dehydrogenase
VTPRRRYAIVGLGSRSRLYTSALLGSRSRLYTSALLGKYQQSGELVGLCDVNATRMRWHNQAFQREFGAPAVPTCRPEEFGRLLREQKVDAVIVTSIDSTHDHYIVEAVRAGCDVITEKPLTIDAERCQAIVDAVNETGAG